MKQHQVPGGLENPYTTLTANVSILRFLKHFQSQAFDICFLRTFTCATHLPIALYRTFEYFFHIVYYLVAYMSVIVQ